MANTRKSVLKNFRFPKDIDRRLAQESKRTGRTQTKIMLTALGNYLAVKREAA